MSRDRGCNVTWLIRLFLTRLTRGGAATGSLGATAGTWGALVEAPVTTNAVKELMHLLTVETQVSERWLRVSRESRWARAWPLRPPVDLIAMFITIEQWDVRRGDSGGVPYVVGVGGYHRHD